MVIISCTCLLFQIDRQLSAYMRRVEDVLGKGWENHVEGQKLKADGDSFRQKLNTQELFDEWSRKVGTMKNVTFCLTLWLSNSQDWEHLS